MKMKKITNYQWERVERNRLSYNVKIGFYDADSNRFQEVARFRNASTDSGANYAILQIWSCLYDFSCFESQGSNNTCGGYNKPIANLEGCLYQFKNFLHENYNVEFTYSDCGSVESLMHGVMNFLQVQYKAKLFIIFC